MSQAQLAAAEAAYLANADYDEAGSVAKARSFVTACRKLLALMATTVTKGPNSLSQRVDLIQSELERARNYVLDYSADDRVGPSVVKADFTAYRD